MLLEIKIKFESSDSTELGNIYNVRIECSIYFLFFCLGSYFASIVLELPSDARSISQRYIDISREREKGNVNDDQTLDLAG